jgi:uncharacterized SAM-binding protein YcdF (DUF218 family)
MAHRVSHFRRLGLYSAVLLLALGALFCLVFPRVGYSVILDEAPEAADLVLVMGGDFYGPRLIKGAELAILGYAPAVLISGPPYQGRPEGEFAIDFAERLGYPRSLFRAFGHNARSTIDEAVAIRHELDRRGVKRVLMVTSAYHSRRASLVLRLFCPGVRFTSVPAGDFQYHPERWWSDPYSRRVCFSEWGKITGSVLVAYPVDVIGRSFGAKGVN